MISRNLWIYALSAIPKPDLKAAADRIKNRYVIRHCNLPEEGLGLLKMIDGALGDPYYLGEFPVASAHVELHDRQDRIFPGGAHVMHDSADYATDLAVCDAALAGRLHGWEEIAGLIDTGIRLRDQQARRRKTMLSRTRVDFDLLSTAKDPSDDD